MESLIQKYPALSISDFKITDDLIKKFNERDIESDSLKFIKIILEESGESERHDFFDLNSMLHHNDLSQKSYMFFEYTSSEIKTSIYYVQKDLMDRNVSLDAIIEPLPFKRRIFINSKDSINSYDLKLSNRWNTNTKFFGGIEFYTGLAALIHVFTNTKHEEFALLTDEAKEFGKKINFKGIKVHETGNEITYSPNDPKMDSSLKMGYRERAIYIRGLVESLTFRKTINKDQVEKLLVNIDKLIEDFDNEK